jgi:hypothetical protein
MIHDWTLLLVQLLTLFNLLVTVPCLIVNGDNKNKDNDDNDVKNL